MPICLGWGARVPADKFIVAGWGRTSNDPRFHGDLLESGAYSSKLQKLEVSLIPDCSVKFPIFGNLSEDKQICAGGELGKGRKLSLKK